MQRKTKVLVILTLVFMLAFSGVAVGAENYVIEPQASYVFAYWSTGMEYLNKHMIIDCESLTQAVYNQSITAELQKLENGSWKTIATFYESDTDFLISIYTAHPVDPGTYQVRSTHRAGGETKIGYSGSLTVK